MKEMKTIKFPGVDEAYEIVDMAAREQLNSMVSVPACGETDEGKLLSMVNGVPTWVAIPNAEEMSF